MTDCGCDDRIDELEDLVEALRLKLNYQAERIDELEEEEDNIVKRDLEDLLPIERWAVARRSGENLSANCERATYVWDKYREHAHKDRGKYRLTSDQIENILVRDSDGPRMEDLNRNTRVRVMKMVARGTGFADEYTDDDNLIQLLEGEQQNILVAEAHELDRHIDGPDDSISPETGQDEGADLANEVDAELDRLAEATVTDGGVADDD